GWAVSGDAGGHGRGGVSAAPGRRLEELDGDSVGIAQVEPAAAAVDARVDVDGRAHERVESAGTKLLVETAKVVDDEAEMRRADVPRLDLGALAGRREVLEELDQVLAARHAQVRH